ncbi:hypothetical protein BGX28_005346 [Mortierella sp. GBA30]|nr:hypothetical protein BGX28_005346 [Mortierella sp. GBA30]
MAPFASLAIMTASLLSVMAAPLSSPPISPSNDITSNHFPSVGIADSPIDEISFERSKIASVQISEPNAAAVNWELMMIKARDPVLHQTLEKRAPKKQKKAKKSSPKPKKKDNKKPSGRYNGRGTWFSDTRGSCNVKFSQNDMIAALNQEQMGALSGRGSQCGKMIRVSAKGSNKSVVLRIVDTCPKKYCKFGALDISRAAFQKFAPMSKGVLDLTWSFV